MDEKLISVNNKGIERTEEPQDEISVTKQIYNEEKDPRKERKARESENMPTDSDQVKEPKSQEERSNKKRSTACRKDYKETAIRNSISKKRKITTEQHFAKNVNVMKRTILSLNQHELDDMFHSSEIGTFRLRDDQSSSVKEFEDSHSSFNDDMPPKCTEDFASQWVCTERDHVTCSSHVTELPSKWTLQCGRDFVCTKFIDAMFIPKNHRAYDV